MFGKEEEEGGLMHRLETLDPRIIYAIQIIILSAVLINPIGMPMPIAAITQQAFDAVDAIPPGSTVLLGNEVSARGFPDDGPIAIAFLNHLFAKDLKIVIVTIEEGEGTMNFELKMVPRVDFRDEKYGEDWVHLGFVTGGGEISAAAMADSFHDVFPIDHRGNPVESLPLMQEVHDINDIDFMVVIAGSPMRSYLRQINSAYGTPLTGGCGGVMAGEFLPFVNPAQLQGLVVGMGGAAQYEKLLVTAGLGQYGLATVGMDAQSMGYLIVIIAIIIGNVAFAISKLTGGK